MTKRDFFRTIIKLFGLYLVIRTIFYLIPSNIGHILSPFEPVVMLWSIGISAITILVFIFLLFKTDRIIDMLRLDRGFDDENIHFENFSSTNLIKLALIIFGGFLILDNFSDFLSYCFYAFKEAVELKTSDTSLNRFQYDEMDYFNWGISGLNLILGYLMITNYKRISVWLTRNEYKQPIE